MTQPHNVDGDVLDISQIEEPTFTVVDEEEEREVRKKPSHLTIEVRNPEEKRELQPWELVDPPAEEEKYGTTSTATAYAPPPSSLPSVNANRPYLFYSGGKHALIPKSSYYFGPPPLTSGYGTNPIGHIGVHHPREILRVERDYSGGEVIQFAPIYPLELEGRVRRRLHQAFLLSSHAKQ